MIDRAHLNLVCIFSFFTLWPRILALSEFSRKKMKRRRGPTACLLTSKSIKSPYTLTYSHSQLPNCSAFPRLNPLPKFLQTSILTGESYSILHLVLFDTVETTELKLQIINYNSQSIHYYLVHVQPLIYTGYVIDM